MNYHLVVAPDLSIDLPILQTFCYISVRFSWEIQMSAMDVRSLCFIIA